MTVPLRLVVLAASDVVTRGLAQRTRADVPWLLPVDRIRPRKGKGRRRHFGIHGKAERKRMNIGKRLTRYQRD